LRVIFIPPQLINDAILGCQFLKEYGITLDFKRGSSTYFKDGRVQEQLFIQPAGCQETGGCDRGSIENIVPNLPYEHILPMISSPDCDNIRSRDSSVGIATGYGLDDLEGREFESR
jgi:hypothetical protein